MSCSMIQCSASTKQRLMRLAQGYKAVPPVRLKPATPRPSDFTTEPLHSLFENNLVQMDTQVSVKDSGRL